MAVRAKRFEYTVELGADGAFDADGSRLTPDDRWSAEHLVLAGLVRCSVTSLRYHARRASITVAAASGTADGAVTKREDDGRYGLVEASVEIRVTLDPLPDPAALADLLAKAERDCFVGASLTVRPAYHWHVDGPAARDSGG